MKQVVSEIIDIFSKSEGFYHPAIPALFLVGSELHHLRFTGRYQRRFVPGLDGVCPVCFVLMSPKKMRNSEDLLLEIPQNLSKWRVVFKSASCVCVWSHLTLLVWHGTCLIFHFLDSRWLFQKASRLECSWSLWRCHIPSTGTEPGSSLLCLICFHLAFGFKSRNQSLVAWQEHAGHGQPLSSNIHNSKLQVSSRQQSLCRHARVLRLRFLAPKKL